MGELLDWLFGTLADCFRFLGYAWLFASCICLIAVGLVAEVAIVIAIVGLPLWLWLWLL